MCFTYMYFNIYIFKFWVAPFGFDNNPVISRH